MMILKIIKFELKERFRQWISLVFFLMLIFQGVWYTKGTFDYYVNDGILMNAPSIFYKNFAGLGMLMVIMIVILTGGTLYKDIQHKSAEWVYTLPINEKKFFVGRYLSAFLVNLLLALGYFVGMLLVPYSGIGEAHRFGPAPILQMCHAVLIFLIPNLLLFNSVIFFALVYSKKMSVAYLCAFLTIIFFLLMQTTSENSGFSPFIMLGDPNGFVAISEYLEGISTLEKNTGFIEVKGYLLWNRLLWLGISFLLFVFAYLKFSFKDFINAGNKKSKNNNNVISIVSFQNVKIPVPQLSHGLKDMVKKVTRLSALEFYNIVRPSSFKIIIGIVILMIVMQNLLWNGSYYIGPEIPITSNMTFFRLAWGVFITMLLMIWSGELFFKDKTVNIWQITNVLPVPVWVIQLSKLFAMIGVAFILSLVFIVVGIVTQIIEGGIAEINIIRYVDDLLGYKWGWLTYVLQICFVFFIAGFTSNRFLTHIISVGIFLIIIISLDMGLFEQLRYAYPLVPGVEDYSEISGYGIWRISSFWFFLMWLTLAVVFVFLGILFWERGIGKKWYQKLSFTGSQLNIYAKIVALVFFALFIGLQVYIGKQAYSDGNFITEAQEDYEAADYEKKYANLLKKPQPKYHKVNLQLHYYPEERKATYTAQLTLRNSSNKEIEELYLNFKDFVTISSIRVEGKELVKVTEDEIHHLTTYKLPSKLEKDASLILSIKAEKQYIGFTQHEMQGDLTFNGSYGSIKEFLPVIGYDSDKELLKNRNRVDEGLEKLTSRMLEIHDEIGLSQDVFSTDSEWVSGKITLSTTAEQSCIAPGKLMKTWKKDARNYYEYEVKNQAPFNWHIGSAAYKLQKEGTVNNVKYQIISDEKHPYNIELYATIIEKSLAYLSEHIGEYPYEELRLMEINKHHDALYAFPNVVAISEKEGWVANTTGLPEKAYLYLTVAGQLYKHWISTKIHIANVQGANMLKEAIPEALALQFIKNELGEDALNEILEKKHDLYAKERNNDPNGEPVLLYGDGVDYLEINKGAIELYHLSETLGFKKFNDVLNDYMKNASNETVIFKTLYNQFLTALSASEVASIKKKFEMIE